METKLLLRPGQKIIISIEVMPEPSIRIGNNMPLDDLAAVICDVLGSDVDTMKGKSRKREIVSIRHLFIYVASKVFTNSQSSVSRYLGLDHTSILNANQSINGLMDIHDRLTMNNVKKLENILNIRIR